MCSRVIYTGSPLHKRDSGDFGLAPPAAPRANKTLCDVAGIRERALAQELLRAGVGRGLVSEQTGTGGQFPQNIWSVTDDGIPLEAQLENAVQGAYHGYPLPTSDPLREQVLAWWKGDDE